jgi:ribulose-5-phosphate 4-epimerase/fuculose-1-phosphate aldolase
VTRSGSRFRNLGTNPEDGILLLSIGTDGTCLTGCPEGARPTIEVSSHALAHAAAAGEGWGSSAVIHVHPPSILALSACSHSSERLEREIRMAHPEVDLLLGGAVRFLDYIPPGTPRLSSATGEAFAAGARAVVWRGHGVAGLGRDLDEACDAVEITEAAAAVMIRRASFMGRFGSYSAPARRRSKGRL